MEAEVYPVYDINLRLCFTTLNFPTFMFQRNDGKSQFDVEDCFAMLLKLLIFPHKQKL